MKLPPYAKLALKLLVTGLCLWYVGQKINWGDTLRLVRQADKGWLALAALFFTLSKLVSSFRLNYFFRDIRAGLSEAVNLRLYWLGMYYNLFLPGGIGGDAYKVILLNRRPGSPGAKKLSAAVLLDRLSGVAGLGILAAACAAWVFAPAGWAYGLLALTVPGLLLFLFIVRRWFPSFVRSFWPTLGWGLAVQLLQMICIACIMRSIGIHHHLAEYQLLFLLSSIVAIFPFTIGGLGAREIVFLWGAQQFALQSHEAVFISLLFYLITVLVSLVGIWWVYQSPFAGEATSPDATGT